MRTLILSAAVGARLALPLGQLAWSKAHVPLDRVQVCDAKKSKVKTVRQRGLSKRLAKGDCRLPACDFANVFQTRDACNPTDADGDGFCDLPNPRDSAVDVTPACFNPF